MDVLGDDGSLIGKSGAEALRDLQVGGIEVLGAVGQEVEASHDLRGSQQMTTAQSEATHKNTPDAADPVSLEHVPHLLEETLRVALGLALLSEETTSLNVLAGFGQASTQDSGQKGEPSTDEIDTAPACLGVSGDGEVENGLGKSASSTTFSAKARVWVTSRKLTNSEQVANRVSLLHHTGQQPTSLHRNVLKRTEGCQR